MAGLFCAVFALCTLLASAADEWGYEQNASMPLSFPANWGSSYPECNKLRQTPINIVTTQVATEAADRWLDVVMPANFETRPVVALNEGHTIKVDMSGRFITLAGSSLSGAVYTLAQFHFHTSSEHVVDGTSFPMEMHMVFFNAAKTAATVIGLFFELGDPSPLLQPIIDNLKGKKVGVEVTFPLAFQYSAQGKRFYEYEGSLTTPPCSEIVHWIVQEKRMTLSAAQLTDLQDMMHKNNRPLQALNNRIVTRTTVGVINGQVPCTTIGGDSVVCNGVRYLLPGAPTKDCATVVNFNNHA
jgi:carbonic anhydrase